jgi:hypothetical protein
MANSCHNQAHLSSGSRPQDTNATPSVATKPQPQHAKFNVPLLDDSGDDYTHWCKMVSLVLKYRGLWDIVDSSTPAPSPTNTQAHLKWSQCDQEAHLQLILSLSHAPHNHVLDAKTAKEVWDLLKVHYQGDNDLRQHYLLECLFTTVFWDSKLLEPQIAKVVSIACQLTDIGFSITNQLLTGVVRVKLPES